MAEYQSFETTKRKIPKLLENIRENLDEANDLDKLFIGFSSVNLRKNTKEIIIAENLRIEIPTEEDDDDDGGGGEPVF